MSGHRQFTKNALNSDGICHFNIDAEHHINHYPWGYPGCLRYLPPLIKLTISYETEPSATNESNERSSEFKKRSGSRKEYAAWGTLVKARQLRYKPMLTQLHDIEQHSQLAALSSDETAGGITGQENQVQTAEWYRQVKKDLNWYILAWM
jgi:hypothetical protein